MLKFVPAIQKQSRAKSTTSTTSKPKDEFQANHDVVCNRRTIALNKTLLESLGIRETEKGEEIGYLSCILASEPSVITDRASGTQCDVAQGEAIILVSSQPFAQNQLVKFDISNRGLVSNKGSVSSISNVGNLVHVINKSHSVPTYQTTVVKRDDRGAVSLNAAGTDVEREQATIYKRAGYKVLAVQDVTGSIDITAKAPIFALALALNETSVQLPETVTASKIQSVKAARTKVNA